MKAYTQNGELKVTPGGGAGGSVTSAQFNALSQKVSTISQNVSVISQAVSVETAARVAADDALSVAINVVSNAVSNEISVRAAADASLANGISVVSNALSNEISNRISADNVLSVAINVVSNAVSAAEVHASTASAAATSADAHANTASAAATSADAHANTASAAATSVDARVNSVNTFISGISARSVGDISTHGLQSVINALSNRISAVPAGGGSVTSTELSAVSAQAASAINVVSARVVSVSAELASLIQIASAAATSADVHANTVSARVVSVSAELVSLIQIASAAATSADTHANTASGAATSVDGRVNSVNTFISGISARSVGNVSTHGLQSVIDALSNRISAVPAGGGSVTSAELQAVSAQAASAINVVSTNLSNEISSRNQLSNDLSNETSNRISADNLLSNAISALSTNAFAAINQLSVQHRVSLINGDASIAHAGHPVYAAASANTFRHAEISAGAQNVIGILIQDTAISAMGVVQLDGAVSLSAGAWDHATGGAGGLVPGTIYYLGVSPGELTGVAPAGRARPVGVAQDAEHLLLELALMDDQTSAISALSQGLSVVSARVVSVSAELGSLVQIASAAATSADTHANTVSARVVSVSAELVSLITSATARRATNTADQASITVSTAITVSGVSIALTAGQLYYFQFNIPFTCRVPSGIVVGVTGPATNQYAARYTIPGAVGNAQISPAANGVAPFLAEVRAINTKVSTTSITLTATTLLAQATGIINPSAGGSIKFVIGPNTSGGANSGVVCLTGCNVMVWRIT